VLVALAFQCGKLLGQRSFLFDDRRQRIERRGRNERFFFVDKQRLERLDGSGFVNNVASRASFMGDSLKTPARIHSGASQKKPPGAAFVETMRLSETYRPCAAGSLWASPATHSRYAQPPAGGVFVCISSRELLSMPSAILPELTL